MKKGSQIIASAATERNTQEPLTTKQLWGKESVPEPTPKDACPTSNKRCKDWDPDVYDCFAAGGPFMCLAVGRCLPFER